MTLVFWFSSNYALRVLVADGRAPRTLGRGAFLFNRSLTVPLLCCGCGFEVEERHQLQGGITQLQSFDRGPQVDDVALDGALGIEALEDVFFQVDTEGASLALAVHGTGPTPLVAPATQLGEQVEVFEDTLDGQLALHMREVEPGAGRRL
jgi:hypothetical protein